MIISLLLFFISNMQQKKNLAVETGRSMYLLARPIHMIFSSGKANTFGSSRFTVSRLNLKVDWPLNTLTLGTMLITFTDAPSRSVVSSSSFQTIKCLLIYPNPESALNEEAGKLLLEHYDDYSSRAKMMTEIHAKPSRSSRTEPELPAGSHSGTSGVLGDTTAGKKRPIDKSSASGSSSGVEKKKKDKKKALKRL